MSFRQTLPLLTQSKSSKQWISRQFRDPYIKKRLTDPAAYRSRSAFKLLEINDRFGRFLDFKDVQAVVDLGAAPGGWSQVVAEKIGSAGVKGGLRLRNADSEETKGEFDGVRDNMGAADALSCEFEERNYFRSSNGRSRNSEHVKKPVEQHWDPPTISDDLPLASSPSSPRPSRGTVVAVDLLPIDPILGVHTIRGDFLLGSTTEHIQRLLASKENIHGKADVILSDMAANITGNIVCDIESSLEICEAVFEFASSHLRSAHTIGRKKGGILLVKFFEHPLLNRFRREKLDPNFQHVRYIKPDSSRKASREGYFFCQAGEGHRRVYRFKVVDTNSEKCRRATSNVVVFRGTAEVTNESSFCITGSSGLRG